MSEDTPFDPQAELAKLGITAPEPIELPEVPVDEPEVPEYWSGEPGVISSSAILELNNEYQKDKPWYPVAPPPPGINPKDLIAATKVDLSVVPPSAMLHLATAMMDGANKYGPFNWRDNPVLARVYLAAAMRHTLQLLDGENFDPISNVHHAGHAMACLAIYLDAVETGNLSDDRPKKGVAGAIIRRFTPERKLR